MIRATRSLVAAVAVVLLSGASQAHAQNAFGAIASKRGGSPTPSPSRRRIAACSA